MQGYRNNHLTYEIPLPSGGTAKVEVPNNFTLEDHHVIMETLKVWRTMMAENNRAKLPTIKQAIDAAREYVEFCNSPVLDNHKCSMLFSELEKRIHEYDQSCNQ